MILLYKKMRKDKLKDFFYYVIINYMKKWSSKLNSRRIIITFIYSLVSLTITAIRDQQYKLWVSNWKNLELLICKVII